MRAALIVGYAVFCLAACGGAGAPETAPAPPAAQMLAAQAGRQAERGALDAAAFTRRRALAAEAAAPRASAEDAATRLLDWAEANYPAYVPGHQSNRSTGGFVYRYYPATGVYLIVEDGLRVYVLGGPFGNQVWYVGLVSDFVGAAPVPPVIVVPPTDQFRIVGQGAVFAVQASSAQTPSYVWEARTVAAPQWAAVPGATAPTLTLPPVAIVQDQSEYRVRILSAGGEATSGPALLTVRWGDVTTNGDTGTVNDTYAGSDGGTGGDSGTDGGGAGAGADAGGGLGKVVNAKLTVTRLADGALVGEATTHAETGLVKVRVGPGAGPLLLTLTGTANAQYFDEGRNAMVPFGPERVLHALVATFDENVGVSAFTEAAYRYALNQYAGDPQRIAAGQSPLLRSGSLVGLTRAQVLAANAVVRNEVNRLLPSALRLASINSLATPLGPTSGSASLPTNRYGVAAVVAGGFARVAADYQPTAATPALDLAEQLARDLTDGVLNGFALDGAAAASGSASTYDRRELPLALSTANHVISSRFGQTTTAQLGTPIVNLVRYAIPGAGPAGDVCTGTSVDSAALMKDGTVNVYRSRAPTGQFDARGCPLRATTGTLIVPYARDVRSLQAFAQTAYALHGDGTVSGWGSAMCGALANGAASSVGVYAPLKLTGLRNIRSIAAGPSNGVARDKDGAVWVWGSNTNNLLGLGDAPVLDVAACDPATGRPAPGARGAILTPRRLPGLADIAFVASSAFEAFAVDSAGAVWRWGMGAVPITSPARLEGIQRVVALVTTHDSAFMLRADGTVWGIGENVQGVFGDGFAPKRAPVRLAALTNVIALASDGQSTTFALQPDGTVWRWGSSPTLRESLAPAPVQTAEQCVFDYELGGQAGVACTRGPALPMPKMRHLVGGTDQIVMTGLDGTNYVYYPHAGVLAVENRDGIGAPR